MKKLLLLLLLIPSLLFSAPKFTGGDCSFCEKIFYPSGQRYVGSFKNGRPEGSGVMYMGKGYKKDKISGLWVDGLPTKAIYKWSNGDYFTGSWKKAAPDVGIHFYTNGTKEIGHFINENANTNSSSWDNKLWNGEKILPNGDKVLIKDGKPNNQY